MTDYLAAYFDEDHQIAQRIERQVIADTLDLLYQLRKRRGRLFVLGNGGSAANASHAVNDFRKIAHIEAYAPSDNIAELTAWANDFGWDVVYEHWLEESNLNQDDALFILSVGGGSVDVSRNLVRAMRKAQVVGASILSIVGRDGGMAKELSTVCIHIPTVNENTITPHVEDWQLLIVHYLTKELSHTL